MVTKIACGIDFLVAKTRAQRSRLYEGERLTALANLRSVTEVGHHLFPDEKFADHVALERRLVEEFGRYLASLWRYLQPPQDRLFVVQELRLELENLKLVLRAQAAGQQVAPATLPQIPLPPRFHWPGLRSTERLSPDELIRAIPEPRVRRFARLALESFEASHIPLYLEAGLDQGYFALLQAAYDSLPQVERASLERLLRYEFNMYNLMFVLRARVNYRLESELVVSLAAHFGSGAAGWVAVAAQQETARDIVSVAPPSIQEVLGGETADLAAMERRLWCGLYAVANNTYYAAANVAALYAYAVIKRLELANLITLVEAVRYGLSAEQANERFLRPKA
jgi:vacuolar-type H+-ATPase subunit C/Vma6